MDIRKSSRCEGWREEVAGWVTEQEKDSGGGDLKDTKAVDILKSKNGRNIEGWGEKYIRYQESKHWRIKAINKHILYLQLQLHLDSIAL